MKKYAVACVEMFDRFSIYFFGPFDDFASAEAYANRNAAGSWWVIPLEKEEN